MKLFRFADFWNRRTLDNSAERIERVLFDRTRRLVAGLYIDERFENVWGSLVVARGRGKTLRVLFCESASRPIPDVIRDSCRELSKGNFSSADYRNSIAELADVQTAMVEELKLKAGKYVDRVLAVSVVDPGIWQNDYRGEISWMSLCDATRLAERTGANVIDAWPDRDIAVGGKGQPLDPLCLWLLLADRDRRIARKANFCISVKNQTTGYLLPPSDGLDADSPDLRPLPTEGLELIEGILKLSSIEPSSDKVRQLLVSGVHSKELLSLWQQLPQSDQPRTVSMLQAASSPQIANLSAEQLLCTTMKWISDDCQKMILNALREFEEDWSAKRARLKRELESTERISARKGIEMLRAFDDSLPEFSSPGCIMVEAPAAISDALVSRLRILFDGIRVSGSWREILPGNLEQRGAAEVHGPSLSAALLGFFHVDQVPANLPSLTGADQLRILGRLTPGRPNAWRNLLREMADYEPSAMKLRDAV